MLDSFYNFYLIHFPLKHELLDNIYYTLKDGYFRDTFSPLSQGRLHQVSVEIPPFS